MPFNTTFIDCSNKQYFFKCKKHCLSSVYLDEYFTHTGPMCLQGKTIFSAHNSHKSECAWQK